MIAFEVSINGTVLYTAGTDRWHLLQTQIQYCRLPDVHRNISVSTCIPKSQDGPSKSMIWEQKDLNIGDEVIIRIVDTDKVDQPELRGHGTLKASIRNA